jgi:hypothetical protein
VQAQDKLALAASALHRLGHVTIAVHAVVLLLIHQLVDVFCDFERESDFPKPQIFGGNKARKEDIDAFTHTKRHGDDTVPVALRDVNTAMMKMKMITASDYDFMEVR